MADETNHPPTAGVGHKIPIKDEFEGENYTSINYYIVCVFKVCYSRQISMCFMKQQYLHIRTYNIIHTYIYVYMQSVIVKHTTIIDHVYLGVCTQISISVHRGGIMQGSAVKTSLSQTAYINHTKYHVLQHCY